MGTQGDLLTLLADTPGPSRRGQPATAAAAGRTVRTGSQRARVLMAIVRSGAHGCTDWEASVAANISRPHVAGTRRAELVDEELVEATPQLRATDTGRLAVVYQATAEGRLLAAELARTP